MVEKVETNIVTHTDTPTHIISGLTGTASTMNSPYSGRHAETLIAPSSFSSASSAARMAVPLSDSFTLPSVRSNWEGVVGVVGRGAGRAGSEGTRAGERFTPAYTCT